MSYFANAGEILLQVVFGLILFLFVFRVLLQAVRANFYNPICQFFYKTTNPVLMPLRRILPPIGRWDTAGIGLSWLIACLKTWLIVAVYGHALPFFATLVLGFAGLLDFLLTTYLVLIFARVILSFVGSSAYHPALPLLGQLTEPLLLPFRRLLPRTGMFDFAPLLLLLAIYLTRALILAPINDFGGMLAR